MKKPSYLPFLWIFIGMAAIASATTATRYVAAPQSSVVAKHVAIFCNSTAVRLCDGNYSAAHGGGGTAATISVGMVSTGSPAAITNSGTSSAAVLNFTIPPGATGSQGAQGVAGSNGTNGTNGLPGSKWWYGTTTPATVSGSAVGDYYYKTSTGDIYGQPTTLNTWVLLGNIIGPQGPAGSGTSGNSTFASLSTAIRGHYTQTGALGASQQATDSNKLNGQIGTYYQQALGFTPYNATNPNNYIAAADAPVQTVFGRSGTITAQSGDYTAAQVGLGNVTNNAQVTAVTGTAPIVSSGGTTPVISIPSATTSVDGYLNHNDWNTFNGKQAALGFTPYSNTNPSNFINSAGAPVQSVAGKTGDVTLVPTDVGLGNVTNNAQVIQTQSVNGILYGSGNITIRDAGYLNYSGHDHTTPVLNAAGSSTSIASQDSLFGYISSAWNKITWSNIVAAIKTALGWTGTSGNSGTFAQSSGTLTAGNQATFDGSGNLIASSYAVGASGGTVSSGTTGQFAYYASNGTVVGGRTLIAGDIPALSYSPVAGSSSITTVGTLTAGSIPYSLLSGTVPTWNQNTTGTAAGISGSQTANYVLAAPNGSAGTASFRALLAADIPTLNQSTTGSAAKLTTARSIFGQSFDGSANIGGGTLTLGGNLTTSGAYNLTLVVPATGSYTLPTAGTLIGSADTGTVTNTMLAGSISPSKLSVGTGVATAMGNNVGSAGAVDTLLATGTATLGTSAISSGTCATVVTVAGSGIATTDVMDWGFNGDPTGVTGYAPSTNGMLTIMAYPTSGNINFKVCNNTASSVTPGTIVLNWKVRR